MASRVYSTLERDDVELRQYGPQLLLQVLVLELTRHISAKDLHLVDLKYGRVRLKIVGYLMSVLVKQNLQGVVIIKSRHVWD